MSVDLRTRTTVEPINKNVVELHLPDLQVTSEWLIEDIMRIPVTSNEQMEDGVKISEILKHLQTVLNVPYCTDAKQQSICAFLFLYIEISRKYCGGNFPPVKVTVTSELPMSAGLGSSAAFAVSLSTAFLALYGKLDKKTSLSQENLDEINRFAFQAEIIIHGKPSGIDNSICTYGGALIFQAGKIKEFLPEVPPLKILLVNTRIPRNTRDLVASVRQRFDRFPAVIQPVLDAIDAISRQSWQLLKEISDTNLLQKFIPLLKDFMVMNQHLLNCLGVGHAQLDNIFKIASSHQLGAKLTGAGGGGCALILLPLESALLPYFPYAEE
ncbi:mevalonate kinase isoform X2 [Tachypleus tridentatus]|uniref:mevalonate kinase isoform X2 n=1 Tax=Tachypleus tridentatus TaxID=6853 RepID=UPI003FCEF92D